MVIFEGQRFERIDKFDCRVLSFSNKKGGGFSTVLPISSKEHRESRGNMPDKVEVFYCEEFTTFQITDDWHGEHTIKISNNHQAEIKAAIEAAKAQGLMV